MNQRTALLKLLLRQAILIGWLLCFFVMPFLGWQLLAIVLLLVEWRYGRKVLAVAPQLTGVHKHLYFAFTVVTLFLPMLGFAVFVTSRGGFWPGAALVGFFLFLLYHDVTKIYGPRAKI